jgi:acetate kinase
MCAVAGGASVDTSMGLTPLEGLMMGTRCGEGGAGVGPAGLLARLDARVSALHLTS